MPNKLDEHEIDIKKVARATLKEIGIEPGDKIVVLRASQEHKHQALGAKAVVIDTAALFADE